MKSVPTSMANPFARISQIFSEIYLPVNPIENLWCIVKRNVERREPKNLTDLEHFLVEEWNKIDNDLLVRLVGSMRRRCELLIENDGE